MRRLTGMIWILLATVSCVSVGPSSVRSTTEAGEDDATAAATRSGDLERKEGLFTFLVDRRAGRIWLQVPENLESFLYVEGLTAGLGSNPVGLDRGQLGDSRIVDMRRIGDRLMFVQPNLRYRAEDGSPEERVAVGESFASSVLWAGEVDRDRLRGAELVDLTPFLIRDAHDVSRSLERAGQGGFKLDPERSAVDLEACLAFPDNLEFESLLTFSGENPGPLVEETAASPREVTLVQHHSFIRLPDEGYRPRVFDPRAGSFEIQFADYSASLADSIERRWIVRHRLRPGEPIVYYVDSAIPEPIRSAVVEGAGWWSEAFAAAGFPDGYRVEILPPDVHPLDVRYNVIQWVHRSTRGWSYGGGIVDPRSGEMLKGQVSMGSLRIRQDRLLFEGLTGTSRTGTGAADDPIEVALARIRQLAAHEVGHTLGLAHNFAASTYGGRASVMDYPAPLVRVSAGGELDFSEAYGVGVGEWDIHAIRWAYADFGDAEQEAAALETLVAEGLDRGLVFLTDHDARPAGAAQPLANLWDNGSDPVAQLELELEVRRIGLERFAADNVPPGSPLALLEEVLVPLYLHHRYQLEAAVKVIGGVDYRYKIRGDSQPLAEPLPASRQLQALEVILRTLDPGFLDLSDEILALLLPRPAGYGPHRELFTGFTAPVFDPLAAAGTAANATIEGLLQRERAARLVDFHRRDPSLPDFDDILTRLFETVFAAAEDTPRRQAIRERVQHTLTANLIALASDPAAAPEVRGGAERTLLQIRDKLQQDRQGFLLRSIDRFLERTSSSEAWPAAATPMPPGQPIGSLAADSGWSGCSW